jgi:hypothetical protein
MWQGERTVQPSVLVDEVIKHKMNCFSAVKQILGKLKLTIIVHFLKMKSNVHVETECILCLGSRYTEVLPVFKITF